MASEDRIKGTRVTGVILRKWDGNANAAGSQSTFTKCQHLELLTPKNSRILISLRSLNLNYHLRLGDRISLHIPALRPLYQLPSIPDDVLATTASRTGAACFPEKDGNPAFQVVTPYNVIVPNEIMVKYQEQRRGIRPQMTFKLLADQIVLQQAGTHLMYLSGILTKIRLVDTWQRQQLYCMPCECGNVVFANTLIHSCTACQAGKALELRPNPQIIAGIADETGSLHAEHNFLVADQVWEKLLGGSLAVVDEHWLRQREEELLYHRLTWIFMWLGRWGGGRLVLVDVVN